MDYFKFTNLAIIGVVVAAWQKIKDFVQRFIGLFIITIKFEESSINQAIMTNLWKNFKKLNFGPNYYTGMNEFVRPLNKMQLVAAEKFNEDTIIFYNKFKVLFAKVVKHKDNNSSSINLTLSYFRGTFKSDDFVIQSVNFFNAIMTEKTICRFYIERIFGYGKIDRRSGDESTSNGPKACYNYDSLRLLQWKKEDIGDEITKKSFDFLAFPADVLECLTELRHWKDSEKWYKERNIPWKRGWLIHGIPGTGKSSFIKAVANELNMPIFIFDLMTLSNEEFSRNWRRIRSNVPCIVLLEDFNIMFKGKENSVIESSCGLTFDCILNCISGVENSDGILLFITTNDIKDVDQALGIATDKKFSISTRPGRIDRILEMKTLDKECRYKLARRILKDCPSYIEGTVADGDNYTGAQFVELCTQIALKEYWNKS